MLRCMPSTRTQIYLTEAQRHRIDAIAAEREVTMAEVIRDAVDAYIVAQPDIAPALRATFGAVPDAAVPSRSEWSHRG